MIRFNMQTILNLENRHSCESRQDIAQHAFLACGKMLNYHKSHTCINGQKLKQHFECVQAAGRSANSNNRKFSNFVFERGLLARTAFCIDARKATSKKTCY